MPFHKYHEKTKKIQLPTNPSEFSNSLCSQARGRSQDQFSIRVNILFYELTYLTYFQISSPGKFSSMFLEDLKLTGIDRLPRFMFRKQQNIKLGFLADD